MQWTVYWDRPQALINEYISSVEGFISFAYPNWGSTNRGVHAKGEYGMGSLRADHMGLLDTEGRWLVPTNSASSFETGSGQAGTAATSNLGGGWIDKAISMKTIEEAYYIFTGLQYNTSPIRTTENQFRIAGITTPVHSHLILSVLEEPLVFNSEPLVIEPEKALDWSLRTTVGTNGAGTLQGESLRILGLIVGQHHALIQQVFGSEDL
ncbi:MAG: hypothetical protein CMA60_00085 [Euryarchaeota archaeon]|nr:hypothetical protein [Euryarchaeota archaeon]